MNTKKYVLFIIVLTIVLFSHPFFTWEGVSASSADTSVRLHLPGLSPRFKANTPVLVGGLWHYLNVTTADMYSRLTLELYRGTSKPSVAERNENTYYSWTYDTGQWEESTNYGGDSYSYIREANCKQTNGIYSFYLGIDDVVENTATDVIDYENWTLDVSTDDTLLLQQAIRVDESVIGVARQSAEFYLRCEPFTQSTIVPSHPFRLVNSYSVPLSLNLSYTQFGQHITTTNTTKILQPSDSTTHELRITTPRWPPGSVEIEGSMRAIPQYVIPTGIVALQPTPVQDIPYIKIFVGHSNYTIFESPESDIVFQYEETLEVEHRATKNITTYLSGKGNASISITCENASLIKILSNTTAITEMPFMVQSTNTSEHPITVQAKFPFDNATAHISYDITTEETTRTFTTAVHVGPRQPLPPTPVNTTVIMVAVAALFLIIIGYMIYNHIKYRRR